MNTENFRKSLCGCGLTIEYNFKRSVYYHSVDARGC